MKITLSSLNFKAKPMPEHNAQHLKKKLLSSKYVDIVCHQKTDRDSLNTALVMQNYLTQHGVQSRIIVSQNLVKLGSKTKYNYIQSDDFNALKTCADTILCVDFSDVNRVESNILDYIRQSEDRVLCIDHHDNPNILPQGDSLYVDPTAQSTTSIIYRFLEANHEKISQEQAYRIMLGLVDDGLKRNLFELDAENGIIKPTQKLEDDKYAYEIFVAVNKQISDQQRKTIIEKVDIMANLTPEEERFKAALYSKMEISSNGKIAYVAISPDSEEWRNLGGDNPRTSTILNRFRQDVIKNNFKDNRLNNVELALVFYESNGTYRLSGHCKNKTLLKFFKYINNKVISGFVDTSGGHPDRAGGCILNSTDKDECEKRVNAIISCSDFYD